MPAAEARPRRSHQSFRVIYRRLLTVGVVALVVSGCGIKKAPSLPDVGTPKGVRDLRATIAGEDILLEWTTAGLERIGERAAKGFYVYRADEPADADVCEGCPIMFRRVGLVRIYRELPPEEVLSYREPKRSGLRYIFKVAAFNDLGLLGADSNLVRLTTD